MHCSYIFKNNKFIFIFLLYLRISWCVEQQFRFEKLKANLHATVFRPTKKCLRIWKIGPRLDGAALQQISFIILKFRWFNFKTGFKYLFWNNKEC